MLTVPSFELAPSDPLEPVADFLETAPPKFGAVSFGPAPRNSVAPRHAEEELVFRTLFWCATETDSSGYVMEWGKCAVGCKADPAGSYIPLAPRAGPRYSRIV